MLFRSSLILFHTNLHQRETHIQLHIFSLGRSFQIKDCLTQLTYLIWLFLLYICSCICYLLLYISHSIVHHYRGIYAYLYVCIYHNKCNLRKPNVTMLLHEHEFMALIKTYINNIIHDTIIGTVAYIEITVIMILVSSWLFVFI